MLLPLVPHLLFLSVIFHMHWSAGISLLPQNQTSWSDSNIPAFYVIGDSLADPGNNNHIRTLIKANFPPYGRDFDGHIPTGRFSNGKLITDFLVSALGIKELLPPYMDQKLRSQDLRTGVSFASAGAGYDNITSQIMSAIPAWKQLELLKECLKKVKEHVGEERGNVIVTDSLYAVILGSNDFLTTYFSTRLRSVRYNLPAYISLMVEAASSIVKDLYALGARKIMVTSLPPLGCVPLRRTLRGGVLRECDEVLNAACVDYNAQLSAEITSIGEAYQGSKIIYIDIYNQLLNIINDPQQYGFEDERLGCCGTGTIETSVLCSKFNPFTCLDASKFVFWDSLHPSHELNRIMVSKLLPLYNPLFQ